MFQSPEGEVLTVQPWEFSRGVLTPVMFQSPEGEVLTVQLPSAQHLRPDNYVSVPRRGSADGATSCLSGIECERKKFQSPEGEVLTVQHEEGMALRALTRGFSPPKGKC